MNPIATLKYHGWIVVIEPGGYIVWSPIGVPTARPLSPNALDQLAQQVAGMAPVGVDLSEVNESLRRMTP